MTVVLDTTDPGLPAYVETGYVETSYQAYTANPDWLPPSTNPPTIPPNWTAPPPWATDPTNQPVQGIPFDPPSSVPGFPTGPTTLPPPGSPTGASSWAAGPTDLEGDQMGYGPPNERVVDDGLQFPAHVNDLVLRSQWHGLASTVNPGNIALLNLQLATIIAQAIQQSRATAQGGGVVVLPGGSGNTSSVTLPIPPTLGIEEAVQTAIIQSMMQGSNLWYELVLRPVTNGPFAGSYVVNTLSLALPLGIDLSATSPGGNQP